ncbi:MAG: protein kinase, partial [Planctomycetaceae bacterium]
MSNTDSCPSDQQIQDFGLGKLDELQHVRVEAHIGGCTVCQQRLEALDDLTDGFVHCVAHLCREDPAFRIGSSNSVATPETIGPYRILREVGRGGMGIVYEAEHALLKQRVALKILPLPSLLDPNALKRFLIGARAAAVLEHPNIVRVDNVGEDRGYYYQAMRFIEGPNLAQVLSRIRKRAPNEGHSLRQLSNPPQLQSTTAMDSAKAKSLCADHSAASCANTENTLHNAGEQTIRDPFPISGPLSTVLPSSPEYFRHVAELVARAADALHYAHEVGVVHRDVKPSNLMLDERGHLWVTDFGLARFQADGVSTTIGPVMGTARYMSQEQILGNRGVVDQRSDVYSLGVTLYELLTLTQIFPDKSQRSLLAMISTEEPTRPRVIDPRIPARLEYIVQKAMSKDADDRYATAAEFAKDLRNFLAGKPQIARPLRLSEWILRVVRKHPRSLSVAATIGGVLLAMMIGLAMYSSTLRATRNQLKTALSDSERYELQARTVAYAYDIQEAARMLDSDDPRQAFDLLMAQTPPPGRPDVRGVEWEFLRNRAEASRLILDASDAELSTIKLSPDGAWAATAGMVATGEMRGKLFLYETAGWKQVYAIPVDETEIRCVAFSPDSTKLATAGHDGFIRLFDRASGMQLPPIENAHPQSVIQVLFTRDGKQLISAGYHDGIIRIWDVETRKPVGTLEGHSQTVNSLKLSPDGTLLASGSDDSDARLWNLAEMKLVHAFRAHGNRVLSVAFSPDGQHLAACSKNQEIHLWNVETGRGRRVAKLRDDARDIVFHSDGRTLALGEYSGVLRLITLPETAFEPGNDSPDLSRDCIQTGAWVCHEGRIMSLTFANEDRNVITVGQDGNVCVNQITRGHNDATIHPVTQFRGWRARFHGENEIIEWRYRVERAESPQPREVRLLNPVTLAERTYHCPVAVPFDCVTVSPDGSAVLYGHNFGRVTIQSLTRGETSDWDIDSTDWVSDFLFTPDAKTLIVCSAVDQDGVRIYDWPARTRREGFERRQGHRPILSPNGELLVFVDGRHVVIWNLASGDERVLEHQETIEDVAISPDGRWLAAGGAERRVWIYDLIGGTPARNLSGHPGIIRALEFVGDGRTLATADDEGFIKFWNVETGRFLLDFDRIPSRGVTHLRMSPDRRFLWLSTNKPMLRVYDLHEVANGPQLERLPDLRKIRTHDVFALRTRSSGWTLLAPNGGHAPTGRKTVEFLRADL